MMPLEELVMMQLENTYISFLQKNTYERVVVQKTLLLSPTRLELPGWNLCIRSILMTFAGRAIFYFNHLCQGHLRASIEPW